jgi:excinuclease ABC subunit C
MLAEAHEALASFVLQFYATEAAPPEVLLGLDLPDLESVAEALTQLAGRNVKVRAPQRGLAARWVELTRDNAANALRMRQAQREGIEAMYVSLADELGDLRICRAAWSASTSATRRARGRSPPAWCSVRRGRSRRNTGASTSAASRPAMITPRCARRCSDALRGSRRVRCRSPIFCSSTVARSRSHRCVKCCRKQAFHDQLLVGVSKGPDRRPGQERLHVDGESTPRIPGPESPALRLVQRIRDEAHRFAIAGHRRKRAKRFNESILETVPGLGPAKRRALLRHFGGLQGVLRAGVADLEGRRHRPGDGPHGL